LIQDFVVEHKDHRSELLLTKSPYGLSLTECLCSVEASPCVRDALDEIIVAKVPLQRDAKRKWWIKAITRWT
jgi:hypothetical protein